MPGRLFSRLRPGAIGSPPQRGSAWLCARLGFTTPHAPENNAINSGNFSQAVRRGNTIYIGGRLAIDQARQVVVDETPEAAIRKAYENLIAILTAAEASVDDVVMLSALLTDLDDLETLNAVQAEFFSDPHPPRSTFKVAGLPHGPIELTAVVVLD